MDGVLVAAGLLLLWSGAAKVRRPQRALAALRAVGLPGAVGAGAVGAGAVGAWAARAVGVAELAAGGVVLAVGGRTAAAVVLVSYLALATFAARLRAVAPAQDCGCLGTAPGAGTPATRWHVGVDLALAASGALALARPPDALLASLGADPAATALLVVLAALLAYAATQLLSGLPALAAARRGEVLR